jgi:hypothetical protein
MAAWTSNRNDKPGIERFVAGARAANATGSPAVAARANDQVKSGGLRARIAAIAFWGAGLSLLVGAATSGGLLALALVPLLGFGYVVFSLIAMTADRNVE